MSEPKQVLLSQKHNRQLIDIWQQAGIRHLYVDDIEQSRIDVNRADILTSPVNQAFLAAFLFTDIPKTVLLAGLGGGELARYLHQKQAPIHGDAVELDQYIAQLAKEFFEFPARNWQLIVDDIRNIASGCYDFIVVDIAEDDQTPAWLSSDTMLTQFRQQLSAQGVLAINLLPDDETAFISVLAQIRKHFHRQTLCLSLNGYKNIIVFAFRQQPVYRDKDVLHTRASSLSAHWGFDFSALLLQLEQDNPAGSGIF